MVVVVARWACLSISDHTDLLGISHLHRTVLKLQSIQQQPCRRKCLVDEEGQRKTATVVPTDKRAKVTQMITLYNRGQQKAISECMSNLEAITALQLHLTSLL